jgi:hypothetical protein
VLIGRNGVGKTRCFDLEALECFAHCWPNDAIDRPS